MSYITGAIDIVVAFFLTGGAFMYPILVVFAFGLAISIERLIKLMIEGRVNRKMWEKMHPVLTEGDFDLAREMVAEDQNSTISRLLSLGLERQGKVRRREDIEIAMEEGMMEIIPQLEKRTPYIALLANISTLLGLLGTIMGLIAAFTAVANANPAEKADLLSASISVAMNTTAFGLMAGIPLLIIHAFLTSKAGEIVDSLEMASVKMLNVISLTTKRQNDGKLMAQDASATKANKTRKGVDSSNKAGSEKAGSEKNSADKTGSDKGSPGKDSPGKDSAAKGGSNKASAD